LCNEAGFLIEDKLNRLLIPLQRDEQSLMRLDSIFKALGIESLEDVERLARYFINPAKGHDALIEPNEVVKALKKFLEHSKGEKSKKSTVALKGTAAEVLQRTIHGDLNASLQSQRSYWDRMANILTEKNYSIWQSVYTEMSKYHILVRDRWNLYQEINDIRKQNDEMKILLRQYLTAKVNEELQVPPAKVLLG
jgi:dynein regulatory complex protein 1